VKLRGDDFFGRLITIHYSRSQTPEEEACEARYLRCPEREPATSDPPQRR
jgi:hypothetical protein